MQDYHIYTISELELVFKMLHARTGSSYKTLSYDIFGRSDRYNKRETFTYRTIVNGIVEAYNTATEYGILKYWPQSVPKPDF